MPKNTVERRIDGRISGAPAVVSGGGGGGGGGGGVTDHGALTGLGDDDHSQYLTAARGDALFLTPTEGNAAYVPVARTVTAGDGMGGGGALSANIALAVDATVVRTTRQVIAGDGMTGGGALSADRTLTLGTPGDVTISTTSAATSTSHTHAVTNSSDVHLGESVLLSSNAGKLRLENIEVGVTASAKPVLITNDTPNMERVGILCQPDPQFALDVGGPCRAEVFVGPHAIQLKAALLIAHFDAAGTTQKPPLTGEPNGHRGQTASVVGGPNAQPYFKPGKFGRALQVGMGTSNLILNPSFETPNMTGYNTHTNGTNPLAVTAYDSLYGGYSMRWQRPGDYTTGLYTAYYTFAGNLAANTTYTFSVHVKRLDAADLTQEAGYAMLIADAGASFLAPTAVYPVGDGWYRFVYTKTLNATPGNWVGIQFGSNQLHYTDGWQLELGAYATPYHDGSLGPLSTWGGTAHASQSNRWHSRLTYPRAGNISGASGTLMAWIFSYGLGANQGIAWAGAWSDGIGLFILSSGEIAARIAGGGSSAQAYSATTMPAFGWHHVAMTWSVKDNKLTTYLDGVAGTPVTGIINADALGVLGSTLVVGDLATSNYLPINGYIDDLAITGTAMTANEIRAVYESNAPVFAESSVWAFRATPKGLVWADENGLWVRDTDGNDVLGVYGGADGAYAWGGQSLDTGDVMIGRGAKYLRWDDSAGTLVLTGTLSGVDGTFSGSIVVGSTNKLWLNDLGDGALAIGGASKASAPFRVTAAGALTATNADISGTITATSGAISGTLSMNTTAANIRMSRSGYEAAGIAGASSVGDTVFWAGGTYAARASAPFRVIEGGSAWVDQLTVTGAVGSPTGTFSTTLTASGALNVTGTMTLSNAAKLANGSVSVPALAATARSNAGVYFTPGASSAAALVQVTVDGAEQLRVAKGTVTVNGVVSASSDLKLTDTNGGTVSSTSALSIGAYTTGNPQTTTIGSTSTQFIIMVFNRTSSTNAIYHCYNTNVVLLGSPSGYATSARPQGNNTIAVYISGSSYVIQNTYAATQSVALLFFKPV